VLWLKNSLIGNTISQNRFFGMSHIAVHFGHVPAIFEEWFAAHHGDMRKIDAGHIETDGQ